MAIISLPAWRTATGQDNNSIAADPQYINPTGSAAVTDLHISSTSPTPVESTGFLVASVTDDWDSQTRASLTPTDIGADAGNFIPNLSEIDIVGNAVSIPDGSSSPSLTNHTDFGSQSVCSGTIVRTFTINNTGTGNLTLSNPVITGAAAGDYSLTLAPSNTVAPGGTTTFQVTFDPSATGVRSATITINNNDANESVYDFNIQGTGVDPEINIQGNSTTIADDDFTTSLTDHTDFGSVLACSGSITRIFTIQNNGTSNLNISSVVISGLNAGDFSITTFPASSITGPGSTTFEVTFDPLANGLSSAYITINNNDCNESVYDFAIQGNGTVDITPPVTPSIPDATGQCSVTITAPTTTDNCSGTVTGTTVNPLTYPFQGTYIVHWTFTDGSGNTTGADQNVIVNDNTPPVVNCQPVTLFLDSTGNASTTAAAVNNGSTDNCGIAGINLIPNNFNCANIGSNSVTLTVTDIAGNTGTCITTVTVVDNIVPSILCPSNITVSNTPGICGAVVTYSAPVATDNCTGTTTTLIAGLASGSTFPIGTTVNTYRVVDAGGNSSVCSFTVTVNDVQTPIVTCPVNIIQPNTPGQCGRIVNFTPTATDNCSITITSVPASGTFFSVGTTTVTVTAMDASSNSSTCTFTVTINDTQAPTISCAANMNVVSSCVPATVTLTSPSVSDNCGGVTITNNHPSTSYPAGVTTVTWTATDVNGNSSTCLQTVTVSSPEADILGNGYPINNASNIISLTNWTDFGSVPVCSTTVTRTYVIKNTGTGTLNLTGTPKVQITGLHSADYTVIQPLVSSLAPGASASFQVIFDPSVAGYRNARITVPNNDCNEGAYYYAIRGTGIACSSIYVPDPSGQTQTNGNDNNEEGGNNNSSSTMSVEDNNEMGALIYPNPSNGVFTLELNQMPKGNTEIRLLNNLGQVIYSSRLMVQTSYYDFSYLSAGSYYIHVTGTEANFTKTIIITQTY